MFETIKSYFENRRLEKEKKEKLKFEIGKNKESIKNLLCRLEDNHRSFEKDIEDLYKSIESYKHKNKKFKELKKIKFKNFEFNQDLNELIEFVNHFENVKNKENIKELYPYVKEFFKFSEKNESLRSDNIRYYTWTMESIAEKRINKDINLGKEALKYIKLRNEIEDNCKNNLDKKKNILYRSRSEFNYINKINIEYKDLNMLKFYVDKIDYSNLYNLDSKNINEYGDSEKNQFKFLVIQYLKKTKFVINKNLNFEKIEKVFKEENLNKHLTEEFFNDCVETLEIENYAREITEAKRNRQDLKQIHKKYSKYNNYNEHKHNEDITPIAVARTAVAVRSTINDFDYSSNDSSSSYSSNSSGGMGCD